MQEWLHKNWWIITLNGVFIILFGVFTVRLPLPTFNKLVWGLGLLVLISGIILIVVSFHNLKRKRSWVLWLIEGIFNSAVGILIIFNRSTTIELMFIFFGIWAIVLGVAEGFISIKMKEQQAGKKLFLFNALLCIAFGIILFYNPHDFRPKFKIAVMVIALLAGLITIYISFVLLVSSKKQLSNQDDDQLKEYEDPKEELEA